MKKIVISVLLIAMVFGWMLFIFSMSAEPAEVSSETSGNTIRGVLGFIYPGFRDLSEAQQNEIVDACQHFARKLAHFSIYTVLGILLEVNALYHFKKKWQISILAILAGVLYAVSDEIHQTFVPGRSGQVSDVVLDTVGVISGVVLVTFINYIITKKKMRSL